jgi:hypothetical protein
MTTETVRLPELVRRYLARALSPGKNVPATVRVQQQTGQMWTRPGARAMAFEATEDFAVEQVAFSWRARFPVVGPRARTSSIDLPAARGSYACRCSARRLQTQSGPETDVGQAMRYLAELAWAPHRQSPPIASSNGEPSTSAPSW